MRRTLVLFAVLAAALWSAPSFGQSRAQLGRGAREETHESATTVPHGKAWRTAELAGDDLSGANRTGEQARGGLA